MARHAHSVRDANERFAVKLATRAISNRSKDKAMLVQGDHDSEQFTFEMPRYVDGHDMALSTVAQIHYDNEGSVGVYECPDLAVSADNENNVTFTWLISGNATKNAGKLSFLVKLRCYDGDAIAYEWNTTAFDEVTVAKGKNYSAEVVEQSADAIERLRADLEAEVDEKVEAEVSETFDDRLKTEVWTFEMADGTVVEKTVWVP